MSIRRSPPLRRRIADFCRGRLPALLAPRDLDRVETYLLGLVAGKAWPPMLGRAVDWLAISDACQVAPESLEAAQAALRPALKAILSEIPKPRPARKAARTLKPEAIGEREEPSGTIEKPRRRGYRPRPIVEFPQARFDVWDEPETFGEALSLHIRRHGETTYALHRALVKPGELTDRTTIASWRRGTRAPRSQESLELLRRIERRYQLPRGYFKDKLPHPARATVGAPIPGIGAAEQRRLAWHLPDDFAQRSVPEQEEILEWVRRVIVSGSTDYRRYQAAAAKTRFGLKFNKGLSGALTSFSDTEEEELSSDLENGMAERGRMSGFRGHSKTRHRDRRTDTIRSIRS